MQVQLTYPKESEVSKDSTSMNRRLEETCNWIGESPEVNKKEYSITSIEQELLTNNESQENKNGFMAELLKRCPCIKQLRKGSKEGRKILTMLKTLERYNNLMKKLVEKKVVSGKVEGEKWSEFLKKNRRLRIEIKCLITDEEENQRKINELKKSINAFGIHLKQINEPEYKLTMIEGRNSEMKKELISFRNLLLEENEELLFQLKRKLI